MRRNNILLSILPILILSCINLSAQTLGKEYREILELQDTRSLGENKKLLTYLHSDNEDIILLCLRALANIADSNSVDSISSFLLSNKNESLQKTASFSLGQIPCERSRAALLNSITRQSAGFQYSIEALGKVGNEDDLNEVCSYISDDSIYNEHLAASIYNFAIRKIKNENSVSAVKKIINNTVIRNPYNRGLIRLCSYAFNRIGDKVLLKSVQNEIMMLTLSGDPDTRMWAFSSLGKIQENSNIGYFLDSFDKESDWRVRVNILNAIGNLPHDEPAFPKEKIAEKLLEVSQKDSIVHVVVTSLSVLGRLFAGTDMPSSVSFNIKHSLKSFLYPEENIDWHISGEAIKSLSKIFKDSVKNDLFSAYSLAENYDLKAEIIRSFGNMDNGIVFKEIRDSISADVQRYNVKNPNLHGDLIGSNDLAKIYWAFVEVLGELDHKVPAENLNTIRLIYTEFLSSKNPAIVNSSLTSLQDSLYIQYRSETEQILLFDYKELDPKKDSDVILEYIQAMSSLKMQNSSDLLTGNLNSSNYDLAKTSADALYSITGKNFENKITTKKYRTGFDWNYFDKLADKKFALIKTNIGNIKISLFPQYAPFTVANFQKLSENGFYDGTIFHRVIPNFVIQGGDKTGTGYGSPGYSIRSEFSELNFLSGYIGMASGGKDTEGSQFFITHSPQPHLDGKYTIFGMVVDDMNVVDRIQTEDYVTGIEFSSN